jgi:hypothetical protein
MALSFGAKWCSVSTRVDRTESYRKEHTVELNITQELAALRRMTPQELRARYAELFGERPSTRNRGWLLKRLTWRLQALAEGDLSQRARQRAAELANDADLRSAPPRPARGAAPAPPAAAPAAPPRPPADRRLPPPGTVLTRPYKGALLQVRVLPAGFEYEGAAYRSLSAVARAITGSHCNGFLFFQAALAHQGGPR